MKHAIALRPRYARSAIPRYMRAAYFYSLRIGHTWWYVRVLERGPLALLTRRQHRFRG